MARTITPQTEIKGYSKEEMALINKLAKLKQKYGLRYKHPAYKKLLKMGRSVSAIQAKIIDTRHKLNIPTRGYKNKTSAKSISINENKTNGSLTNQNKNSNKQFLLSVLQIINQLQNAIVTKITEEN